MSSEGAFKVLIYGKSERNHIKEQVADELIRLQKWSE